MSSAGVLVSTALVCMDIAHDQAWSDDVTEIIKKRRGSSHDQLSMSSEVFQRDICEVTANNLTMTGPVRFSESLGPSSFK